MFFTKLLYGLEVTVVGLIVVFFGLFILIVLIKGMTALFEKFKKPEPAAEAKSVVSAPAPIAAAAPVEEIPVTDDSEVVAAIMAALSCVYEGTGKHPVVRSVRRSSGNWKNAYR